MRRRPRIRLLAPDFLVPGQSFEVTALVETKGPLPVNSVKIRFTGQEYVTSTDGEHGSIVKTCELPVVAHEQLLCTPTTLAPGTHPMAARFAIPAWAPPSYDGAWAHVYYEVAVDVDIPGWLDAHERFSLHVAPAPQPAPEPPGRPALFVFPPGGVEQDGAAFEGSLAATVLVPGGRVQGAVAFLNTARHRYRGFTVALVGHERWTVPGGGAGASIVFREPRHFSTPAPVEGEPMHFLIQVPRVTPTTVARLWRLDWYVALQVDVAWTSDPWIEIPVLLVPPTIAAVAAATVRSVQAPPSVGSPRIAAVWQSVAEELKLAHANGALRGRVRQVEVHIAPEHRGRQGTHLVARLSFPSLQLALHTDDGEIRARDAAQLREFLRLLGTRTGSAALTLSDEIATLEQKDNGQHRERLGLFAAEALRLAAALDRVRPHLPVPTAEAARLPIWQELAARLEGTLQRGTLGVAGTFRGMPAEIEMRWAWGGEPLGARLTLRPPFKLGNHPPPASTPPSRSPPSRSRSISPRRLTRWRSSTVWPSSTSSPNAWPRRPRTARARLPDAGRRPRRVRPSPRPRPPISPKRAPHVPTRPPNWFTAANPRGPPTPR